MLEIAVLGGMLTAASIVALLFKFGDIRKVLWFDKPIDLIVSCGLGYLFWGTATGMLTAAVAGLTLSLVLLAARQTLGYKRLTWRGWREVPPKRDWRKLLAG